MRAQHTVPTLILHGLTLGLTLGIAACSTDSGAGKATVDAAAATGDARLVFKDGGTDGDTPIGGNSTPADAAVGGSGGSGGGAGAGGRGGQGGQGGKGGAGGVGGELPADAATPTPDGAGGHPGADASLVPDAAVVPASGDCEICQGNEDCAGLGEAGQCSQLLGGTFCTRGCAGGAACPTGYRCAFDRCVPAGARCDSCATRPCDAAQRCNLDNGFCEARVGQCSACNGDDDCADGFTCKALGFVRVCLSGCDDGCPEGFMCADGACAPVTGICDACGGCSAPTPVCNLLTRQCQECGLGAPCPAGQVCEMDGHCGAPEPGVDCRSDLDCRGDGLPFCVEAACVACRDQSDCRAGEACTAGVCADQPCAGVACQAGSACVAEANTCAPGCRADADCGGDERLCNVATGQCYQADQRCDPEGLATVCAPGGVCAPDPLDANRRVCTCAFTDPANFQEPNEDHRIPCQPGGACVQLGAGPGVCIRGR